MKRNKPLTICCCETAEQDIVRFNVSENFLTVAELSLRMNLTDKDRDVSDGSVRYRLFGDWVVTFQITEIEDSVFVTILHISLLAKMSATKEALNKLWEIAKILSPAAQVADVLVGRK